MNGRVSRSFFRMKEDFMRGGLCGWAPHSRVHIILSDERTATGQVCCSRIHHILIENECQL
ncbi:hypothetical protein [Bacillus sp. FJAT-27231]|uniref:hypothetical protein n=1 Tax=Bacillus sp. FJAT-27231 TaxID=1679168 RepID=UPI000A4F6D82|nr:hypothetical protein [Bacillus sp. FJAT-27231]